MKNSDDLLSFTVGHRILRLQNQCVSLCLYVLVVENSAQCFPTLRLQTPVDVL